MGGGMASCPPGFPTLALVADPLACIMPSASASPPLPSTPALSELGSLVAARGRWFGGIIRAALLVLAEIDAVTAVAAFQL